MIGKDSQVDSEYKEIIFDLSENNQHVSDQLDHNSKAN